MSFYELLVILIVAIIVIKPKDMPELLYNMGVLFGKIKTSFEKLKNSYDKLL